VVKIIEQRVIDEKGHGHVVVVEGLGDRPIIVCNIYSPVRSLVAEQEVYYERVGKVIEELEIKCLSYSRLSHFGIVPSSECPNCRAFDSPLHMLTECVLARQVWQQFKSLKVKITGKFRSLA